MLLAHPWLAVGLGLFMLCAETCLHFGDIVSPTSWVDLPIHDWIAGGLLVYGGVSAKRDWLSGRAIQAAGWGFMSSLLVAAFVAYWEEWQAPSAGDSEWLSAGSFLLITAVLMVTSLAALVGTLSTRSRPTRASL